MEISKYTQYSLVYCHDNKLIFKSIINDLNQNFTIGNDVLSIIKSSNNILPNKLVGTLLVNGQTLCPLLSEKFFKSWLEFSKGKMILHIPLLTTPPVTSKYYNAWHN